jgi:hypothetical protein
VFTDGDGNGTIPQVFITTGEGEILPVRSYTENTDGGMPRAMTLVFNLPPGEVSPPFVIGRRPAGPGNLTVTGGLLLAGSGEGGTMTEAWVREGADIISDESGLETPLTLADLTGDPDFLTGGNFSLWTVSTPGSASGNMTFYINGMQQQGVIVPGEGEVTMYRIPLLQVPVQTGIRLHIGTSGPGVTNRLAVLTGSRTLPSDDMPPPPLTTAPGQSATITASPSPVVTTVAVPADEEGEGSDPMGNFLCWILNIFLVLGGQQPEPCHRPAYPVPAENGPGVPTGEPTGSSLPWETIMVHSMPEGAAVFLDGRSTGLVTPCEIEVSPGLHTVRIVKEGYLPFEKQVTGTSGVDAVLQPDVITPAEKGPEALAPGTSHHGGLFISSYPASAEIRIDNVIVATRSPVLVYPLREGFHTIQAGIPTGDRGYSARESIRTWVFPDAVLPLEFNLMDATVLYHVNITGESRSGAPFTVNGYYPVRKVPEDAELTGIPSFITLTGGSSYLSFEIPVDSWVSGVYSLPMKDPLLCTLSVESSPDGGEIFLDGIRTGLLTPAVIPNVSAGYHRISVGYPGRLPATELIHISDSQCIAGGASVRYSLDWYPTGTLNLASDPPGAAVSIRGLRTGEVTPCTIEGVPIGIWEVTFSSGKAKKGVDATVEPGSNRTYTVVFD